MNILFTGAPHVGKSTLLERLVAGHTNTQGFITKEIATPGDRCGFELISAVGERAVLAHAASESNIRVSRYGVNTGALDEFLGKLPAIQPKSLLYIDEIGQMQLYSNSFKDLVRTYLAAPNPFLGTLTCVYHDTFTDELRARDDIEIVDITLDNRDIVRAAMQERIARMVHENE